MAKLQSVLVFWNFKVTRETLKKSLILISTITMQSDNISQVYFPQPNDPTKTYLISLVHVCGTGRGT